MEDTESVFFIKRPYVSNGLRRTFFKKIEIMEAKPLDSNKYEIFQIHNYLKSGWKVKQTKKFISSRDNIRNSLDFKNTREDMCFETFELAYIAKVLLIERLKKEYVKELESLRAMMERNCPDVAANMKEIQEKYPEHLI
jgi:hypothetical protein